MKGTRSSISAMFAAGLLLAVLVGLWFLIWNLCVVAGATAAAPALSKQWHEQVYGLDEDEVLRLIPPPYSPARMKDLARGWAGAPPKQTGQLTYHELPTRTHHFGMSSATGDVKSALESVSRLAVAQMDIAPELRKLPADGDWILRIGISAFDIGDQPVDRRMKALQSILSAVTHRNILIEKRTVEKDVIIASGHWNFQPISGGRPVPNPSIHFYTDTLDPKDGAGGGTGYLSDIFQRLEEITHRKVIDETSGPPPGNIDWANNYSQSKASKNEAALGQLLDNLTRQTSLEFVRTRRTIPIWFVREKVATTAPAGSN